MTCVISYYQSNIIGVNFWRVSLSIPLHFILNNLEKFSLTLLKQKFKAETSQRPVKPRCPMPTEF